MSRFSLSTVALLLATMVPLAAQQGAPARSGPMPTIDDRTSGLRKIDGYVPLYWDEKGGTMLLEVPWLDKEFLLSTGLSAGLGSNDLGLDRGQGGQGRVVKFQRVGPRVMIVQPNQSFRSTAANPLERKAVEDSFAKSILWGFTIVAESNGRLLVDATDFFLRDVHGASRGLRPGTFRVDRTRSAFYIPNTKGFPKNTEVDMTLTFVNEAGGGGRGGGGGPVQGPNPIGLAADGGFTGNGGGLFSGTVASVTPTADAVTLREHMSFVELPDANYTPRNDDPRAGYGGLSFVDYSQPIGDQIQYRYLRRHRLVKKDPNAAISEPVEPIRYWVDSGAPEDVKKALIEGASWWNQAFEAAGFRNAFVVQVLPGDADPMDIRYNMINWVHRSTRGWSSGGSVSDPRTGEIIKATVTLGSLRDRQDYMIFEGLLSPYETGTEKPSILYETALKRIRQLSAHEVGHTLGLGHNYYDSKGGWHHRHLEGLRGAHRRLGQGGDQLRLPAVRRRHRRERGARHDHRRRVGAGPALLHQSGHRHPPAHGAVVERRQPGRRADAPDEGAPRGAEPHRREDDPQGRGDDDHRRAARADLHVSPLRGGERVVDDRRPGLRLRDARRRPHAGEVGDGGQPAQGARSAGFDAEAVGADVVEADPRRDSAASAGLRLPPRAVPAHDR